MSQQNTHTDMANLPRRALGQTGRVLPVLGFGLSGPHGQSVVPRKDTHALIELALCLGVEVFDTAPFYGDGEAEARLGRALEQVGESIPRFVTTKGGTFKQNGKWTKDFSRSGLKSQLDAAKGRLRNIDAFFLHGFPLHGLSQDVIAWLTDAKAAGDFAHLGVAARGEDLDVALDTGLFDLVMAPVNSALTSQELNRLEAVRSAGLGVIGIECIANAAKKIRFSIRPADLWYTARALIRQQTSRSIYTPEDSLLWALNSGLADIVLVTTTRQAHLEANVKTARRLC